MRGREVMKTGGGVGGKTQHPPSSCGGDSSSGDDVKLAQQQQQSPRPSTSKMGGEQKLASSSREMRNMAEKMRRDKLNNYVNELAGIVPMGSGGTKRIDKTSVLRLAANYIRMHNILREEDDVGSCPNLGKMLSGNITNSLAEAVGGFLLVVTSTGKVVYITEAVDQFFGHSQVDLLGHSLYNVIHPDDHEVVQQQLIPRENTRRSFFCRMMEKALSRNDPGRYEIIHIVGQLRPIPSTTTAVGGSTGALQTVPSPAAASDHDSDDCNSDEEENSWSVRGAAARQRVGTHMLVSFVRVVKDRPITELSLVESTQDEYITRHSMNGQILYTDHRISFVTGLMPTEVVGTSAFTYMHPDDMVWSIMAQRLMFSSTQGQGVISYRLKCRDGSHVNLRSRGYLEVNKQTGQVESFVCINTVLSVSEASDEIKNQRRKLLPIVTSQDCDDYLINISSTLPPELLTALKALMNPNAVKKLLDSLEDFDDDDKGKQATNNSYSQSGVSSQDGCKSKVLQEVILNHPDEHKDFNPFQSRPKRLCSYESPSSVSQNGIQVEQNKVLEKDQWPGIPSKRVSVDDFPGVFPKKFNYDQESSYQTCTNQQQYTSTTSTRMCPVISSDSSEFYPPPPSAGQQQQQFSPMPYTTLKLTAENCGSESYQQNRHSISSPSPSCDSGIASPMSHETSQSIERSPMPLSPYIQSTDKSPMPSSPYIQNAEKSPMPSSPYIQSVSSVGVFSPDSHDHMKLSPNYYPASQNHSNQSVEGRSNNSNEQSRNHSTRDNDFAMDVNFTNMVGSNNGNGSSNNKTVIPVNCSQMLPVDFTEGKTNVLNYPNGCQWNEKSKTYGTLNGHKFSSNNGTHNEKKYQMYNSSPGRLNHVEGNSKVYLVDQYAADPTRLEKTQLHYQQNPRLQQESGGYEMQSKLETNHIMDTVQGFDQNLVNHSPVRQMSHLGELQLEAEPTRSYHTSSQFLPLEVSGNVGAWEAQGQASEQNFYPQLPRGCKRLLDKGMTNRNGSAAVGEVYNTPHHSHPEDEIV